MQNSLANLLKNFAYAYKSNLILHSNKIANQTVVDVYIIN